MFPKNFHASFAAYKPLIDRAGKLKASHSPFESLEDYRRAREGRKGPWCWSAGKPPRPLFPWVEMFSSSSFSSSGAFFPSLPLFGLGVGRGWGPTKVKRQNRKEARERERGFFKDLLFSVVALAVRRNNMRKEPTFLFPRPAFFSSFLLKQERDPFTDLRRLQQF